MPVGRRVMRRPVGRPSRRPSGQPLARRVRPSPERHHWPMPSPSGLRADRLRGWRASRTVRRRGCVDRPHPGALGPRAEPGAWRAADLRFDRDRGWSGPGAAGRRLAVRAGRPQAGAATDRRRARSASSRSISARSPGSGRGSTRRVDGRAGAGGPAPVRLHRPGDARDGRRRRRGDPRRRVAGRPSAGHGGTPSCRAWPTVRSAGSSTTRVGVHRARGPPRPDVRRDRARPTELRARARGRVHGGWRRTCRACWRPAPASSSPTGSCS